MGEPINGRGIAFWRGFVAANCRQVLGTGQDPGITPTQLLRAWKKVKGTGNRSLSVFVSRRGSVPRKRLVADEATAYSAAVDFFYAKRGNTRRQAKTVFEKNITQLNVIRAKSGLDLLTLPQGITTLRTKILAERNPTSVARKTTKREADSEFNGTNPALESQIPFEYMQLIIQLSTFL